MVAAPGPFRGSIYIKTTEDKLFANLANVSIANACRNIGKHFMDVAIGAVSDALEVNGGPSYGTGTISIASGNMSNGDTVTIDSIVLTGETGTPSGGLQFKIGASAIITAMNLAARINSNVSLAPIVKAVYSNGAASAGVVTVTTIAAGTTGNYAWSKSSSNTTLTPASAMAGGSNGPVQATATITSTGSATAAETMVICNQTLTAETSGAVASLGQFNISATVGTQAANIAAAINAVPALQHVITATSLAGVVTVTATAPGLSGNGFQISEALTNVTVTAFSGGLSGPVLILHKGL